MKNLLYIFILALGAGTISAQDMPTRYATFELFTNLPCPACQSASPPFKTRLKNSSGAYHLISFYPGKPYASCQLYNLNTTENRTRLAHYPAISGSPRVVVGGTDVMHPNSLSATAIANAQGGESWLEVDVDENSGMNRTVTIDSKVWGTPTSTTTKIYAVVVQKFIFISGAPGGYTDHDEVFMKFLSDPNGDVVDVNSTDVVTYNYTLESTWDDDNTYVIAWVMDEATNEIINSGTKFDTDFSATTTISKETIDINVYPNPTTDVLNVEVPSNIRVKNVKINSNSGQQFLVSFETNGNQIQVDVSDVAKGNYILSLETETGIFTKRFSKL